MDDVGDVEDPEIIDGSWQLGDTEGALLAGRWWRWAMSAPGARSPVSDETGEHADWNQPADVWFLAGTYGGRVVRRCAVPAGRPLFFPLLTVQHTRAHSRVPLRLGVARAEASVNGIPLRSREFAGTFRYAWRRRFTWGVWGGIAPLAPGEYVVEIRGESDTGFLVDTTYHLEVVPPTDTALR
ncbi:hypothetical protein ACN20G_31380 (plasmid) [Streptomyces sp. BI20]|uniref:hypothetical protein n=1 Tax=Streptomyces sp. BI20 TaxID=3403460 RepID=UPI003C77C983